MQSSPQYGRTRELPANDVALLRSHLADPALRLIIIKALVYQDRFSAAGMPVDSRISDLSAAPGNAADRKVRQDVIAGVLAGMPRKTFLDAVLKFRIARDKEVETEVRLALGSVISDALYWRVRTPDSGTALFE